MLALIQELPLSMATNDTHGSSSADATHALSVLFLARTHCVRQPPRGVLITDIREMHADYMHEIAFDNGGDT